MDLPVGIELSYPENQFLNGNRPFLTIRTRQHEALSADQYLSLVQARISEITIQSQIPSLLWTQIKKFKPKALHIGSGNDINLVRVFETDFATSHLIFHWCKQLSCINIRTNWHFFGSFPKVEDLFLKNCDLPSSAEMSSLRFAKVTTCTFENMNLGLLPDMPSLKILILKNCDAPSVPVFENLQSFQAISTRLEEGVVMYYTQILGNSFRYEPDRLVSSSPTHAIPNARLVAPIITQPPVDPPRVPSLRPNSDPSQQDIWNSSVCLENKDLIMLDQFDPDDQIVTILVNSSNGTTSLAHCFTVESLVRSWFPILHGFDSKNSDYHENQNGGDNQVYKWVGPEYGGRPVKSEPVFKLPVTGMWIDINGYTMATTYKHVGVVKVAEKQKIGSSPGISRIHGEEVDLYTLVPISKSFIKRAISNEHGHLTESYQQDWEKIQYNDDSEDVHKQTVYQIQP